MTSKYKKYLLSNEWANIRNDLYLIRGKLCEDCGSSKRLQIHHKTYKNIFNEEPEDLIILCSYCHKLKHGLIKIKKKHTLTLAQKVVRKKKLKKKNRRKRY